MGKRSPPGFRGLPPPPGPLTGFWLFPTWPKLIVPVPPFFISIISRWRPARHSVVRDKAEGTTTFRLALPCTTLGSTGPLREDFRLTFIANDNDGHGRKQWVKFTDGLGDEKNPDHWGLFSWQ